MKILAQCLFLLFFFLLGGILWALLGAFVAVCVIILWGSCLIADKLFLSLTHSRELGPHDSLSERIRNLSYRMGIPSVDIFVCQVLPENVYVLDSLWGRSSLVITTGVLKDLEASGELENTLVRQALRRVAEGDSIRQTLYSFLFALIEFPYHILIRSKWAYYFGLIYGFFLTPMAKLKDFIIRSNDPRGGELCARLKNLEAARTPAFRPSVVELLVGEVANDVGVVRFPRSGPWSSLNL